MVDFDFSRLERLWMATVDEALAPLADRNETFYALAFHNNYAERNGMIHAPVLAMNSVEGLDDEADRWSPADWVEPEIETPVAIDALYRELGTAAKNGSPQDWDRVHARYLDTMFAVATALGERAARGEGVFATLSLAPDFIVCVMHDDHGLDGIERSVPAAAFARLFPEHGPRKLAKARVAALPPAERARTLVASFADEDAVVSAQQAENDLVALGALAVPALIEGLAHPESGYLSAVTLARIGAPAALPAVPALLAICAGPVTGSSLQTWAARALGRLGRYGALLASDATLDLAVEALVAGRPTTYPAIEGMLDGPNRSFRSRLADGLLASFEVRPGDFAILVQTTTSKHELVRQDATSALGDPDLGEENRARAVPILVGLLGDPAEDVRRLAAHALGRCGRHAESAIPHLRRLAETDPSEPVRHFASGALKLLG